MTLSATPQARVTPGILPSALRASLSAVPNRSRRFGQHRREHLRPLRRRGADRGQHRRTHRHPRHPCPLRACTARCGRVTPAGHDAEGETRKTTRSGNEPAGPYSPRCRESARTGHGRRCRTPINPPKRSAMKPQHGHTEPNRRLRRLRLPYRLPEKGF